MLEKQTYRLKWIPRIVHIPTSFNGSEVLSILHDAIGVTFKCCQINIVDAAGLGNRRQLPTHWCQYTVYKGSGDWRITFVLVTDYILGQQTTFVMTDTTITSFSLSLTAISLPVYVFRSLSTFIFANGLMQYLPPMAFTWKLLPEPCQNANALITRCTHLVHNNRRWLGWFSSSLWNWRRL